MNTRSIWEADSEGITFPQLSQDLETDAVVIGGGITGITAAYLLSKAGKRVIVLEALKMGLGTTGNSTGNLHTSVDQFLYLIREKWDMKTARAVATSRSETIDMIEHIIAEQKIPCGFRRRPHYIFPTNASQVREMEREHEALRDAGVSVTVVEDIPLPFAVGRAIKIENQAQFQPLAYVQSLAKSVSAGGCRIFEYSKVTEIDDDNGVVTTIGGKVRAGAILMATHTPKGFNVLQTELGPYREYGIAARLRDDRYPDGLFWTLEKPSHSIRSYEQNGTKYLVVIGEEHKTGQQEKGKDYFGNVEEFAHSRFNIDTVDYRWSAQNYRPADGLPFIGKDHGSRRTYLATGFGTNGLLYGPLAASIIVKDIVGEENPWEKIYTAKRFTPAKSAKGFMSENVNVAKQYIRDYLTHKEFGKREEVMPGEGGLVEVKGERMALYCGQDKPLAALSPVCTHLGCIVHWNRMEKSWDCPCHGSRFSPDGEVIEGPAISGLEKKKMPE